MILCVSDQEKSKGIYAEILQKEPSLLVPGMTEFALAPNLKLGLMPETGIARILKGKTPHPQTGNGIPRCERYLKTEKMAELYRRSVAAGAREVSPIGDGNWGDTVGYMADPDGHIVAFARQTAKPYLIKIYGTPLKKTAARQLTGLRNKQKH